MLKAIKRNILSAIRHHGFTGKLAVSNLQFKRILETRPIRSDESSNTELFVLTPGEDIYAMFIAVKSLCFWSRRKFRIFVCSDDDSMTASDMRVVRSFFKDAHLITNREQVLGRIGSRRVTRAFHVLASDPSYPKLSMPACFASRERVIVMDTDIVFHRYPELLVNWANGETAARNYYRNPNPTPKVYQFPLLEEELQTRFNIGGRLLLESGLLAFERDLIELDLLEAVSDAFQRHGFTFWEKELEIYNVLFRIRGSHAPLPRQDYAGTTFDAVSNHFYSKAMTQPRFFLRIMAMIEHFKYMEESSPEECPNIY